MYVSFESILLLDLSLIHFLSVLGFHIPPLQFLFSIQYFYFYFILNSQSFFLFLAFSLFPTWFLVLPLSHTYFLQFLKAVGSSKSTVIGLN
jgi:hypothetical protein